MTDSRSENDPGGAGVARSGRGSQVSRSGREQQAIIRLVAVSRFFGITPALYKVTLAIGEGECVFLSGANGAGKSTLLSVLCGSMRPDEGIVEYLPRPTAAGANVVTAGRIAAARRREICYVPSGVGLYGDLTVRENLRLWAVARHLPAPLDHVDTALRTLGIEEFGDTRVRSCSQGIARRASLATAFLDVPRCLLLDEPLAYMDTGGKERIGALIAEARRRGTTMVIASHEPEFVAAHATRRVVMERGRIVKDERVSPGSVEGVRPGTGGTAHE